MVHETSWNPQAVRAPAASGSCAFAARVEHKSRVATRRGFIFLRVPVAGCDTERRAGSTAGQTRSRPSAQAGSVGTEEIAERAPERRAELGIFERTVDTEADRVGNPQKVWRAVSSQPRLAHLAERALVVPSTRTARHSARRRSHRALETLHMAPYHSCPKQD